MMMARCSKWFAILAITGLCGLAASQEVPGINLEELKRWGSVLFGSWLQAMRIVGEEPCIPLDFVSPPLGTIAKWCPGSHQSIQTALQAVPALQGTAISDVSLSYDYDHKRTAINTEDAMNLYLQRSVSSDKLPLIVAIVSPSGPGSSVSWAFQAIGHRAQKMSQKLLEKFTTMVSSKTVTDETLTEYEGQVRTLSKVTRLTVDGDVKKFDGVPVNEWDATVDVLENDVKVPKKITSTLRLASKFNGGIQETAYSLSYNNGTLNAAYLVRLIAKKTEMGDLNLVIFFFTLSFVGSQVKEIGFEENFAIEKYVDSKAHSFWKDKLAPGIDLNDLNEL